MKNFRLILLAFLLPLVAAASVRETASSAATDNPQVSAPNPSSFVILVTTKLILDDAGQETPIILDLTIQPGQANPGPGQLGGLAMIDQFWLEAISDSDEMVIGMPFYFPRTLTVPVLPEGMEPDGAPARIDIAEPEVTLVLPYLPEIDLIRVLSPDRSQISAMPISKANVRGPLPDQEPVTLPGPSDKFDILIIASGYDAATMANFAARAQSVRNKLLATEPFQSFGANIRVQSSVNTEDLGCYCGCGGIDRLMCCNDAAVIAAAARSGYYYDEIIVIHNTTTYCGGASRDRGAFQGNSYSTLSMIYDGSFSEIMTLHEFGHSFANLCDEYTYGSEGYTYYDCVNCRATCDSWAHLTRSCSVSCDSQPTYLRPEESVMLGNEVGIFNAASIQQSLTPRLRYFIGATNGTTALFQDGVFPTDQYAGTRDTYIAQDTPDVNFGSVTTLNVDGQAPNGSGHANWALLKWDIASIPSNQYVQTASITLDITNHSSGQTYQIYEVTGSWVETGVGGVTWNTKPAWGATALGTFGPSSLGMQTLNLNSAGAAVVQKWIRNPSQNFGFILTDGSSSDGFDFPAREEPVSTRRPKLTVVYSASGPSTPAVIKGPYLQNVTTNSIEILWETDIAAAGQLRYRTTGGAWSSQAAVITYSTPGNKYLTKASLSGLGNNTSYDYQISVDGGQNWQPTSPPAFRTAPATTAAGSFRFVAYGDSRAQENGSTIEHERIANRILADAPLPGLILNTGDLVDVGQCYENWAWEFFTPLSALSSKVTTYPAAGNHEYKTGACNSAQRLWYNDLLSWPDSDPTPNRQSWYAFTYGCTRIISLNTYDAQSLNFSFGPAQKTWLANELASVDSRNAQWRLVFLHTPLYTTVVGNQWPSDALRDEVIALFKNTGVDLILAGHTHLYERFQDVNGLNYVVAGGGGASLNNCGSPLTNPFITYQTCRSAFHYTTLDISCSASPTLEFKARDASGNVFDALTLRKPAPTRPGDCNGDNKIDAADLSACVLEIFDDDGDDVANVAGGSCRGTPGCDSNRDSKINAADLSCTVLIIFGQRCGTAGESNEAASTSPNPTP